MTALTASMNIAPPTIPARRTGVLGVIDPIPLPAHGAYGLEYDSTNCVTYDSPVNFDPVGGPNDVLCVVSSTAVSGIDATTSATFFVRAGVACGPLFAYSEAEWAAKARAALDSIEDVALSNWFGAWLAEIATGVPAASSMTDAVGDLEDYFYSDYGPWGVLWASAGAIERGFNEHVLVRENGKVVTGLGTPVALLPGSAANLDPALVFLSGWPTVYRGESVVAAAPNIETNQFLSEAQRLYVGLIDCNRVMGRTLAALP